MYGNHLGMLFRSSMRFDQRIMASWIFSKFDVAALCSNSRAACAVSASQRFAASVALEEARARFDHLCTVP